MVFKKALSFRTSVLCAVRNLGELRAAARSLHRNNRAFGSHPYQLALAAGNSVYVKTRSVFTRLKHFALAAAKPFVY
jgi:hypothetical protein